MENSHGLSVCMSFECRVVFTIIIPLLLVNSKSWARVLMMHYPRYTNYTFPSTTTLLCTLHCWDWMTIVICMIFIFSVLYTGQSNRTDNG